MATIKVTFTLDETALSRLQDASARLSLPKSEIVREAILEFHDRIGRLSEREHASMLRAFDELIPKIPPPPSRSRRPGAFRTAQSPPRPPDRWAR
jgi:hypothetical protein